MKTYIEMDRKQFDRRAYEHNAHENKSFAQLHDQALAGAEGIRVLEVDNGAVFSRDGAVIAYSWTDADKQPQRVKPPIGIAFFRRGDKGEAFLHAHNF